MVKIQTTKENLKALFELTELRPGLDVKIFADSNEMCFDYRYTLQRILFVEVSPWYSDRDGQILSSEDDILDRFFDESDIDDIEEREAEVQERYLQEVKEVILVTLEADAC